MLPRNGSLLLAAAGIGGAYFLSRATRRSLPRLRGSVVLITGGSRGLGLVLASSFLREGCRVAICARDAAELEAARLELQNDSSVFTVECDVGVPRQVDSMVNQVVGHFGGIDVLVNNAGEIQVGPLSSMTVMDFEQALRVMFWGTVYPTLALLPHLRARCSGRIVNITSIGGKVAVPHLLPYTCAKFAAVGFSEGLRAELAGTGVRVVTIAPGLMRTGSFLNAYFKGDPERESVWFGLSSSLPGISMSAERAARQIVEATRRGTAEKILTVPANLLARWHGLFPGLTADTLGLINRLLLPSGDGRGAIRGHQARVLEEPWMKALTALGRSAARRYQAPADSSLLPAS